MLAVSWLIWSPGGGAAPYWANRLASNCVLSVSGRGAGSRRVGGGRKESASTGGGEGVLSTTHWMDTVEKSVKIGTDQTLKQIESINTNNSNTTTTDTNVGGKVQLLQQPVGLGSHFVGDHTVHAVGDALHQLCQPHPA